MLDGFHQHHPQVAFLNRRHLRLGEAAFQAARNAAATSLDPPDRSFLKGNGPFGRHRLFYEYHLAGQMDAYVKDLPSKIDRILVEIVLLHGFLHIEEAAEARYSSSSVGRSTAVLGWMIQERLQYIILQTGDRSLQELHQLRNALGIIPDVWESRLVGATAQAKALMRISRVRGLRLFPSTLVDDVMLGIDFFIETQDGNGACISVKTDVGGKTRFLRSPEPGYEQAWNRIEIGSQSFREYAHRDWMPILLLMGKAKGEPFTLFQKSGRVSNWAITLVRVLDGVLDPYVASDLILTA